MSIFFEDRLGKQTITFSLLLNNYNPIFNLHKLCGTCSGVGQCIAEKRGIDLSFFFKKTSEKLGLEKPTSLSLEKRRTLSHFQLEIRESQDLANDFGGMARS